MTRCGPKARAQVCNAVKAVHLRGDQAPAPAITDRSPRMRDACQGRSPSKLLDPGKIIGLTSRSAPRSRSRGTSPSHLVEKIAPRAGTKRPILNRLRSKSVLLYRSCWRPALPWLDTPEVLSARPALSTESWPVFARDADTAPCAIFFCKPILALLRLCPQRRRHRNPRRPER